MYTREREHGLQTDFSSINFFFRLMIADPPSPPASALVVCCVCATPGKRSSFDWTMRVFFLIVAVQLTCSLAVSVTEEQTVEDNKLLVQAVILFSLLSGM